MYSQSLVFAGFAAAGAMAISYPVNDTPTTLITSTLTTNATSTVSIATAATPSMATTAIVLAPDALEGLGKDDVKEDVVIVASESAQTPLEELMHILDRLSGSVFHATRFVNATVQTTTEKGHHISEEHAHALADAVALPMAVLHGVLDHVTDHIRNMHSGHLLSELPVGHGANRTGAVVASPEILAVFDKTHNVVEEIKATAHSLIDKLGLAHVAEVVRPVLVAAKELMIALEEHLTGAGGTAAAPGCKECDDDDDDDDDDDECCSHGGFRHGIKSKLRCLAMRFLHRHFKSIFRFLLGDLEQIIDDVEQYYEEAYDGPDCKDAATVV